MPQRTLLHYFPDLDYIPLEGADGIECHLFQHKKSEETESIFFLGMIYHDEQRYWNTMEMILFTQNYREARGIYLMVFFESG
jgi:hypothetical protein